ncbi:MAG: thioredoxin-dependent thiol peroxidase [Myxococcota bacterium]
MATKKAPKKQGGTTKARLGTELPRKIKARPAPQPVERKPAAATSKVTPLRAAAAKATSAKASAPAKPTQLKTKTSKKAADVAADAGHNGIDVGDKAPSFVLKDHTGNIVSSDSLRGSNYVIYFYPKDDTPGCTLEACGFRDYTPRFDAKGVKVLGVSPDSPEAHTRFRKKYELTFPLLSDPEKTLAKSYGVWVKKQNYGREYMGVERSTFFVDRHGVVKKVWRKVRVPGHVDDVLHSV